MQNLRVQALGAAVSYLALHLQATYKAHWGVCQQRRREDCMVWLMKMFDRKAKMDEMETLEYLGWQFVCSGEQLPSGLFHSAVRYRAPPSDQIRTLLLDDQQHPTASDALSHAKELAKQWAHARGGDGRGDL